jgi:hypothetical protein
MTTKDIIDNFLRQEAQLEGQLDPATHIYLRMSEAIDWDNVEIDDVLLALIPMLVFCLSLTSPVSREGFIKAVRKRLPEILAAADAMDEHTPAN